MTKKRKTAYLALIVNTIIWGAAFPIIKPSYEYFSPFEFLLLRYIFAAPLILPIYWSQKPKITKKIKAKIPTIVLLEFIGVPILLSLVYIALEKTSAIEASLIGITSPIFTTIMAIVILKERETKRELKGLFIALFGTLILTLSPLLKTGLNFSGNIVGNSLMMLQNIIWAVYLIIIKRYYKSVPKIFIATISMWVGLVFFGAWIYLTGSLPHFIANINTTTLTGGAYMGILGSVVALTCYLWGQDKIEASEASLFTYLQAIVVIPVAYLLLHELPSPIELVGALIIAFGVYIAEMRPTRHKR